MYSAGAYRDGLFSRATTVSPYQAQLSEFADGSLGDAYRDGVLGKVVVLRPPGRLQRRPRAFAVRGFGAETPPVPATAPAAPSKLPYIVGGLAAAAVVAAVFMSKKRK